MASVAHGSRSGSSRGARLVCLVLGLGTALVVTACDLGGGGQDSATPPDSTVSASGRTGQTSPDGTTGTTTPPRERERRTLPVTAAGQRPPQFVVVSFDGAGGRPLFEFWRRVGRESNATFTFFLSGVYLLDASTKQHYVPPKHKPGSSDIGFSPVPDGADPLQEIQGLLTNLDGAWYEGHEIGTHFNGHFCGNRPGSVANWTTADWTQEINEFNKLLTNVHTHNSLPPDSVQLPFGPRDIVGARTPCLEGDPPKLHAAEVAAGYRYDTSGNAAQHTWPRRVDGLWDMPLALVPVAGQKYRTLSTDYNLFANHSHGKTGPPAMWPQWKAQARATWQNMFDASYTGNRAPVIIGNHFEEWNGRAYTDSLAEFVDANCRRPETYCISHVELADWLDAEPNGALGSFQAGAFPKANAEGADARSSPATSAPVPAPAPATKATR